MMIINEKEVKSCLIFICETVFKDKLRMIETELSIDEKIRITGKVIYDNQPFDISVSFLLDYKNNVIYIDDIDAKVDYLVFKLNFMNLARHVLKDYPITIAGNTIMYPIQLPIKEIRHKKQNIELTLK